MSMKPEIGGTRRDIKSPEGRALVDQVRTRLEAKKKDIRDFFKTNRNESEVLDLDVLGELGLTKDNFVLAKEVYGEMAMEALDKISSTDELARFMLKKRIEAIRDTENFGSAWQAMQLLPPESIAGIAIREASNLRKKQEKQAEGERSSIIEGVRGRIQTGRQRMTPEEAEVWELEKRRRKESETGGGFTGVGLGRAPKKIQEAVGKAEGKVRRGKGFETATGEFEKKAEAGTITSLEDLKAQEEKLKAQKEVEKMKAGLTKFEWTKLKPYAETYLAWFDLDKKEWNRRIKSAREENDPKKADELQAKAKSDVERRRELLDDIITAIKINPWILD